MDSVFKALADPTRRDLLDRLRERDGQTLTELVATSTLSRYGVMRHLRLLEDAGLVVSRPVGRFKYHYLNALPLQAVIDRWVEPITRRPLARAVLDLKTGLEAQPATDNHRRTDTAMTDSKPDFVLETFIRTTPERLWQALTDGALTPQYYFGTRLDSSFEAGAPYRYLDADDRVMLRGEIIDARPGERLEMTFHPAWDGSSAGGSRNVYEIEADGDLCKLTVLHFDLPADETGIREGWARIIAGLKTLLETGEPLSAA